MQAVQTIQPLGKYPSFCRAGDFIYLSGMSARQADGSIAGVTRLPDGSVACDMQVQTRVVIQKIQAALQQVGASLGDCVAITSYLTDMQQFDAYNAVYSEFFDGRATRTTVGVQQLPHAHMVVELTATAYKPV
ncbi:RidA family protein [Undibacterium terreum]|uniref:Translation initiation inhibitor n=1 Tax=Undibacterium terreum TaxID=1224302 RepID=A0A916USA4_9BURK|nr:RidA family protein [Undibacterium terreum]GGC85314.1 translation initiation inhibitor [Undibacterium terreum]